MPSGSTSKSEEYALDGTRGRLGGDFGWASNNFRNGFENRGAGGGNWGAGDGRVPVAMILATLLVLVFSSKK